jgi:adenylate cyclase
MINPSDILRGKILIVDDLESNVLLLERMLRGAGYVSIESTTDPTGVCKLHLDKRYDLILLDLQMPRMDGFQVMEDLKKIETEGYLPILVITAQPGHNLRALKAGARDFISKPFDLAEVLIRVYNMLEVRLLHLEAKQLYQRVMLEQKVSERLLLNVLPGAIAERLKMQSGALADSLLGGSGEGLLPLIADSFPDVTVLFADIVGFTRFSRGVNPEKLVVLLNEIFTDFDSISDSHGLEKIKTIGDSYMAVCGIPVPAADHVSRAANMALDMMDALGEFNKRYGHTLQMRIGIDTGAVVAGVIGKRKFIYDLWGDTVNTASRMESQGVASRIQITESTRRRLGGSFRLEERGTIDVKGNGEMNTWFLNGRSSQNQSLDNSV